MAKKNNSKGKNILILLLLALFGIIWLYNNAENILSGSTLQTDGTTNNKTEEFIEENGHAASPLEASSLDVITAEDFVVDYLKENGRLPDHYISKSEARKLGWQSTYRDLCDAAPGKAIGGDHFGNFEKQLPIKKGRKYTEADINYNCGKRGEHRVVFSNDGLIFITKDHYQTFEEK